MATCKHCGRPLILKDGKCLRCGKDPNEQITPRNGGNTSWAGLPPVKTFNVNGISFNMILVEGDSFYYGLNIDLLNRYIERGCDYKDHFPLVNVNSFYIGETEVTQALWEAVMEERDEKIAVWDDKKVIYNPSLFKGKELPVEWGNSYIGINPDDDFYKFIEKLNTLTTKKFRLPNNFEWEFAAIGGEKSNGYRYAGSNDLEEVGWYKGNS